MSRESEEYLRRMEEELSDDDDSWLEEARMLIGEDEEDVPQVSVRNNDRLDIDLDSYSQDVFEQPPKKKGVGGLVLLAILESLGIAAIILYWLVQLK